MRSVSTDGLVSQKASTNSSVPAKATFTAASSTRGRRMSEPSAKATVRSVSMDKAMYRKSLSTAAISETAPADEPSSRYMPLFDARALETRTLADEMSRDIEKMRQELRCRSRLLPILSVLLLAVVLLASHAIEDGSEHRVAMTAFASASEAALVVLAVACGVALYLPSASRPIGRHVAVTLRAVLVWGLCLVLTISHPTRRSRFLGFAPLGDDEAPCEEAVATQWIALVLGFVAVFQHLPFAVYTPLSQFICLQYLVLGLVLRRPECELKRISAPGGALLGMPPVVLSALQLSVLAGQFAVASWRCQADELFAEVAGKLGGRRRLSGTGTNKRSSTKSSDGSADDDITLKNWVEVLVDEVRQEELQCLRLISELRAAAPIMEASCAWLSSLNGMVSYMSRVSLRMQVQHSTGRAMSDHTWRIVKRTSSSYAPGEVLRKGIHGFIAQSFMADQTPDDVSTVTPRGSKDPPDLPVPGRAVDQQVDELPTARSEDDSARTQVHLSTPEDARLYRMNSIVGRKEALNIGEWHFNALEVESVHGSTVQIVGFELLHKYPSLKREQLLEFLVQLEKGYMKDNPYHTQIHAGDVCNAFFYLVSTVGLFASTYFNDVKRVSVLLAALGHDLGHPGRNSHFLIMTRHHLATTYNDRSVLENFHAASLFRLMDKDRGDEGATGLRLLSDLTSDGYKQARQLIVALILATDTQHHLEALAEFRMRLNAMETAQGGATSEGSEAPAGFDPLNNAKDQQEALAIMFRAADIGHSAKMWKMHEAWSVRVSEEFHSQGDQERSLGLPISPLCDRRGFVLPTSQMGFLQFVCLPTWTAIARFEALLQVAFQRELQPQEDKPSVDRHKTGERMMTPGEVVKQKSTIRGGSSSQQTRLPFVRLASGDNPPGTPTSQNSFRGRSIAVDCLNQCELNLQEWKRQAEVLKAEKEKAEKEKE